MRKADTEHKWTAEEVLELAIEAERTMKDISPFDPAYEHFIRQRDEYLKIAVDMEREANAA